MEMPRIIKTKQGIKFDIVLEDKTVDVYDRAAVIEAIKRQLKRQSANRRGSGKKSKKACP